MSPVESLGYQLRSADFLSQQDAELSETANKTKAIPFCYLAVFEPKGYFTLVLEDLKDSVQGNQLEGCTPAEALIALKALAKLQAPFLANEELLKKSPWLIKDFDASPHNDYTMYNACLPAFLERYKDLVSAINQQIRHEH